MLILGLLIVPGVALLAFGPKADENIPAGRVVVDYWEKWSGEEEQQMRSIVDTFNDTEGAKQNIYVRLISSGSIDQKVMLTVAAGVPPDIAGLFEINLVQFAASGALLPLDELAAAHGITASTYKPIFWPNLHWGGHLYALVSTPSVVALHYNKDELGDRPPPVSIAELDSDAAALDHFGPRRPAAARRLPARRAALVQRLLLDVVRRTHLRSRYRPVHADEPPRWWPAFTWVQQDAQRWGAERLSEFLGGLGVFDSPTNGFLAGTVAMEQQGPWMASFIDRLKPGFSGLGTDGVDDLNLPPGRAAAPLPLGGGPVPRRRPASEGRHLHRLRRADDPARGQASE